MDIPIIDDEDAEDDETFRITIVDMSLPFGARLGDNITADVVIEDDDSELTCLLNILNIHVLACNKCTYISQDIIFDYTLISRSTKHTSSYHSPLVGTYICIGT